MPWQRDRSGPVAGPASLDGPTRPGRAARELVARWSAYQIVVAALAATVVGVIFWGWNLINQSYLTPTPFSVSYATNGIWMIGCLLVPFIVRRPGAALLGELGAAVVSMALGHQWSMLALAGGFVQGAGAELVFARFHWQKFHGAYLCLAALGAQSLGFILDTFEYGYYRQYSRSLIALAGLVALASALILGGMLSQLIGAALARIGALNGLAIAREPTASLSARALLRNRSARAPHMATGEQRSSARGIGPGSPTAARRRSWVAITMLALALIGIFAGAVSTPQSGNRGASIQASALQKANGQFQVEAMGLTSGANDVPASAPQGVLQLPSSLPARAEVMNVPILMYHYIDATPPVMGPSASGLTVRTKAFELQMDFLAKNGYHTLTLEQIYAAMAGLASLPTKPVALTFDDGGLDDYTVAYPILRSRHLVATFFVITAFVGKPATMTWDQLRDMQQGGMSIESHTDRHSDLTEASVQSLRAELTESRDAINAQLGRAPRVLAYPFGHYDQKAIDATRAAGYLIAVTTHQGRSLAPGSVYSWPRVHVAGMESMKGFEMGLGMAVTL